MPHGVLRVAGQASLFWKGQDMKVMMTMTMICLMMTV